MTNPGEWHPPAAGIAATDQPPGGAWRKHRHGRAGRGVCARRPITVRQSHGHGRIADEVIKW